MTPPLLIALPRGLCVSGVTTWAVRLANALVREGGAAGLLLHAEDPFHAPLQLDLDPRVRRFDLTDLPAMERCEGDLSAFIPRYRRAVEAMADDLPVVLSPNLLGDCYAVCAALTQVIPERVRVVGWQHSDIAYDIRILRHFAPMISRFVGVSRHITQSLRSSLRGREDALLQIPYGVDIDEIEPRSSPRGRPLRLLYTGRMEHPQKRVGALVHLSDELNARGIDHELTLLGDGPAAGEIDALARTRPSIHRAPPAAPKIVRAMLGRNDIFVLASRYEGLSVSMLEALASGCVPVMTNVRSGASEAIDDGVTGLLVENRPDDPLAIGRKLADAVARALSLGLVGLSANAANAARARFAIETHRRAVGEALRAIGRDRPRPWPANRPCAYTGISAMGSSIVPPEGPGEMKRVLDGLAGRRVAIHGAGRHTIELLATLAGAPCEIVAICDDDPARWDDRLLGLPIIAPPDIPSFGVTDVVISSHLHEAEIWERAARTYPEASVHRLYGAGARASAPTAA